MTSVGDVVAHLLAIRANLDSAAVTASRAQADAEQALAHLSEVRRGGNNQLLAAAAADAEVARDKAGRYARLLADAARHISAYVNVIAPGAAPIDQSVDAAVPSGERLVTEAEARGGKAEILWRRQVQRVDDTEDALKSAESGAEKFYNFLKQDNRGGSSTGTASHGPLQEAPQIDNPVTAMVMAAGAVAVIVKAMWDYGHTRRARRRDSDDQA
ncbi:hypothetical protein [Micromonospora ureilytica]|uniref:hypothetical protein n=1 Tax=Micromonospora ureilytica TaxID=709868 RepID=UPI002E115E0C|nr:hypothetical protein OHB55_33385 [Micromonospora ureilytica]